MDGGHLNIKFRIWDKVDKRFLADKFAKDPIGYNLEHLRYFYSIEDRSIKIDDRYILQMFTGIRSKNKKDVYEGDLVKIIYSVGDFAWKFLCEVVWDDIHAAFKLIDRNLKSTHIEFPAVYAKTGNVVGNIFKKK